MKNLKMTLAAIALASVSFGSFAAELVNTQPADLQKNRRDHRQRGFRPDQPGKQTGCQSG